MTPPASSFDQTQGSGEAGRHPALTANALTVLQARYLKKDEAGQCVETAEELFRRVARTVADVESRYGAGPTERQQWEDHFYELMISGAFMPNSPTLMNAGREMGMLSACFVLPVRDSINEIFDSIKHTALIQKAGGGTGFAFDELRPTGDYIKSSGGTTSGPISFWRTFSEATNAIQQGAFRRGANMGMMYIHHPDILKFLHAKQDLEQFTNYNISVKVTDAWMQDLLAEPDAPHIVRNPRDGRAYVLPRSLEVWKYDIRNLVPIDCVEPLPKDDNAAYYSTPRVRGALPEHLRGNVYTKRDIWNIILANAWNTGEPGVVFIDRINEHNPTPQLGRIEATNPCGEQPLLPYEACNLGSINLACFVRNPCSAEAEVDWEPLKRAVELSTRFLDDVIDANNYPLPEIAHMCQANRKIGLGIMGFADALYKLNVAYNSDEGVAWGERFMRFINDEAHACSEQLARLRGCFPNWEGSVWQTRHNRPMRNAATTTVAPTGTISIIANCSGGIEPLFALAFVRNVLRGQRQGDRPLVEVNETFKAAAERDGLLNDELLERLIRAGTLQHVDEVPEDVKRVFVCAHDVSPAWHVRMQAAFQRHCDSSISKTINFPSDATPEDVERMYRLAFELGCKGVTVYRDGCRSCQPMALKCGENEDAAEQSSRHADRTTAASEDGEKGNAGNPGPGEPSAASPAAPSPHRGGNGNGNGKGDKQGGQPASTPPPAVRYTTIPAPPRLEPQDLPEIVSGLRIRQLTPFGNMHVKITVDPRNNRELEVFAQLGKGGDLANSDLEAVCRMTSLWLRSGGSLRHVIKQLGGIGSSLQIPTRAGRIMSLGDGLAAALKKYVRAKERFGLRALLLGEVDLAVLDAAYTPAPAAARRHSEGSSLSDPSRPRAGGDGGAQRAVNAAAIRTDTAGERLMASGIPRVRAGQAVAAEGGAGGAPSTASPGAPEVATTTTVATLAEAELPAVRDVVPLGAGAAATGLETAAKAIERGNGQGLAPGAGPPRWPVPHHHDEAAYYKLVCPDCGGTLAVQEGCHKCFNCGWAAC